ncbi:MAG: hypothetical protein WC489_06295 [Patescibacteria group bacterium]
MLCIQIGVIGFMGIIAGTIGMTPEATQPAFTLLSVLKVANVFGLAYLVVGTLIFLWDRINNRMIRR